MQIKKILELNFKSNDIYILEKLKNKLVINKNENGLITLDLDLKETNFFKFKQSISIYSTFKEAEEKSIALYCRDEEILIFANIETKEIFTLNINNIEGILSPIYFWKNKIIIFTTYNGNFYQVDFKLNKLIKVENIGDEYEPTVWVLCFRRHQETKICLLQL